MMSAPNQFHLRWRGQVSGPFSREALLQKLDDHEIGVWHEVQHGGAWMTLEEFLEGERKEKQRAAASAKAVESAPQAQFPPQVPVMFSKPVTNSKFRPKKMKWFAVLGLTLGFAGAHNFYAGYWGTAIAQLLLTVVTVALGFGIFAAWLWALIELLLVHTDRRGVRMI